MIWGCQGHPTRVDAYPSPTAPARAAARSQPRSSAPMTSTELIPSTNNPAATRADCLRHEAVPLGVDARLALAENRCSAGLTTVWTSPTLELKAGEPAQLGSVWLAEPNCIRLIVATSQTQSSLTVTVLDDSGRPLQTTSGYAVVTVPELGSLCLPQHLGLDFTVVASNEPHSIRGFLVGSGPIEPKPKGR